MSTDTANPNAVVWEGLTQGPSREELFDCTKYSPIGSIHLGHMTVNFWLKRRFQDGSQSGSRLDVEIEGLHRGDTQNAMNWFFWGRLRHQGSGDTWKSIQESEMGDFVFGRWDALNRTGRIMFGKHSFFQSPLPKI